MYNVKNNKMTTILQNYNLFIIDYVSKKKILLLVISIKNEKKN